MRKNGRWHLMVFNGVLRRGLPMFLVMAGALVYCLTPGLVDASKAGREALPASGV